MMNIQLNFYHLYNKIAQKQITNEHNFKNVNLNFTEWFKTD